MTITWHGGTSGGNVDGRTTRAGFPLAREAELAAHRLEASSRCGGEKSR